MFSVSEQGQRETYVGLSSQEKASRGVLVTIVLDFRMGTGVGLTRS